MTFFNRIIKYSHKLLNFISVDSDHKELLQSTSVVFAVKVFMAMIAFVLNIVITRQLGAETAGYYFFLIALILILGTFSRFGLDNAITRYIVLARKTDTQKIQPLINFAVTIAIIGSIVISILILLFTYLIFDRFSENTLYKDMLYVAALLIPLTAVITVYIQVFQGMKRVFFFAFFNQSDRLFVLIIFPVLILIGVGSGLSQLIVSLILSNIFVLASVVYVWKKQAVQTFKITDKAIFAQKDKNNFLVSCRLFWGTACFAVLMAQGAQLLTGFLTTVEQVSFFAVSNRVALLVSFFLIAVNSALSPQFAEISAEKDHARLQRLFRSATATLIAVSLPVLIIMFIYAAEILYLFGEDFTEATVVLRVLLIAQLFKVMVGSVGNLLAMSGHEKEQRKNLIISVVVLLLLAVLLIPLYGALGAAIATCAAVLINNALGLYSVNKKLKITLC